MQIIKKLAEELKKPIIIKFKKNSLFKVQRQYLGCWLSKFNKGFRFLLCGINIFSKYAWVVPLTDKRGVSIVNAFQKVLDKSEHKSDKTWVDKGSEFYDSSS